MQQTEIPEGFELVSRDELRELRATKAEYDRTSAEVVALCEKAHEWVDSNLALSLRVIRLFNRQELQLQRQYHNVIAFRERALSAFHALEIVVNGVLMASTHREKDARLRGLLDVMSVSVDQLKDVTREWFSLQNWGDVFLRADSSVPTMQRHMWTLEKQVEAYRSKFGALEQSETEQVEEIGF